MFEECQQKYHVRSIWKVTVKSCSWRVLRPGDRANTTWKEVRKKMYLDWWNYWFLLQGIDGSPAYSPCFWNSWRGVASAVPPSASQPQPTANFSPETKPYLCGGSSICDYLLEQLDPELGSVEADGFIVWMKDVPVQVVKLICGSYRIHILTASFHSWLFQVQQHIDVSPNLEKWDTRWSYLFRLCCIGKSNSHGAFVEVCDLKRRWDEKKLTSPHVWHSCFASITAPFSSGARALLIARIWKKWVKAEQTISRQL